jgi:predicted phage tail protein
LFADAGVDVLPVEQFDLTQFCTSQEHAVKVAKYFLTLRALVTHTISFSTTLEGLNIQAGSFIKVVTESSPYSSANNGSIDNSGVVTSVIDLADGNYDVAYFKTGSDEVQDGTMSVAGGVVTEETFHGTIFTIKNDTVNTNTYVVEQLTFSDEGTVDIVASEYPCNDDGSSRIVEALIDGSFDIR